MRARCRDKRPPIRGERKFDAKAHEDNYLRIERCYGSFSRSFALANSVQSESIQADYHNGVLTLSLPKREEAKPKQIKVSVNGGTSFAKQAVPQAVPQAQQQRSLAAIPGAR
jgi:HSP20 family protein